MRRNPTWEVTNFLWYNSSHNLDCANQINVPDVCFNSTPNGLVGCDGNLSPCDRCGINGCYTGLPAQPAGYGPPDNIQISINVPGYTQCQESNPQSIRRYEVGDGLVLCGAWRIILRFWGQQCRCGGKYGAH
ncbi:hypothetical protein DID88_005072 [Monilinia fructigena]|uniref:Uncharacterized protein n=1 Tax=Monilinia fructigena TaxID=38457 RepID=A0A395IQE0_9HELO|nr:hypothetical protein DID88_005072 [Monilinia fructigena]